MIDYLTYIKENNNEFQFEIGDRIICLKGNQDGYEVGGYSGEIIDRKNFGKGRLNEKFKVDEMYKIDFDEKSTPQHQLMRLYSTLWVFAELLRPEDPEFKKKREAKREEMRLKHMDIDPYGEEDWIYENLNESSKPKYFNLNTIFITLGNLALAEKSIEDLVVGEICVWYTLSNKMKKMMVSSVEVGKNNSVYFNGFSVDKNYDIEIEENPDGHIIGLPSGEVIYLKNAQIEKLKDRCLVHFERSLFFREMEYRNINIFRDSDYHKIKLLLDPNYKKPEKKYSNIQPQSSYKKDDIIICKGVADKINVEGQIGKIVTFDMLYGKMNYLVEFLFRFSDYLHDNSNGEGKRWWMTIDNIKGIYTGDALKFLKSKKLIEEPLEEHEIDDDYHIRSLFKNKGSIEGE